MISPAAFENDGFLYILEGSSTQVLYAAINTDATLSVTGVGQASGTTFSDAFYLFAQGDGTPIAPSHPLEWALALNNHTIDDFLVDGVPPYRPDHRYVFRVRAPAGPLTFGVSDGFGGDNTGRYTIGLCGGTP